MIVITILPVRQNAKIRYFTMHAQEKKKQANLFRLTVLNMTGSETIIKNVFMDS